MCPECNSLAVEVVELSGRGTIYSFSIIHHPPSPFFEYPVLAVLVELEEGIRLVSNLLDVDPTTISGTSLVGQAVEVTFVPTDGDQAVPVFRLSEGART